MSNTLLIVQDDTFKNLPQVVQDKALAETKSVMAFASGFKVELVEPQKFPEKIDFTDSIVRVVTTDDEIGTGHNQAMQRQLANINKALTNRNIPLRSAPFHRASATPERGGVGWQKKQVVTVGNMRLAINQSGGLASLQTVMEEVLVEFAPNNWTLDEAEANRTKFIRKARVAHDEKERVERANKAYAESEKHWRLSKEPVGKWPKNYQEGVGIGLARLIAHEARHQYVIEHFDDGGLGGDSADIFGSAKHSKFLTDDEKQIVASLKRLAQDQSRATLHIETLLKGSAFPF